MKAWRCDLTALSHSYNLYFVACNDTIHVYQPRFPNQDISSEADLILHPPVSSPNLNYCIDSEDPHSITRILVDYLGNEEILLATCDDGDVVGYRIEVIQKALNDQRDEPSGEVHHIYADDIRLFLHRNVGDSAWGLAVHRKARMIAISANTHKVTVLAYALVGSRESSPDFDFSSSVLVEDDFPSPRRRDHVITLWATHNIPSVSFNNNGDDPEGLWLYSSSIDGKTTLWDLDLPEEPAAELQMGWCQKRMYAWVAPGAWPGECTCYNAMRFPHGAWGAIFLDPNTAHEISCPFRDTDVEPQDFSPYFWDASNQKQRFFVKEPVDVQELVCRQEDELIWDNESEMALSDHESSSSDEDMEILQHDLDEAGDTTESMNHAHDSESIEDEQREDETEDHPMGMNGSPPDTVTIDATQGLLPSSNTSMPLQIGSDLISFNDDDDEPQMPPGLATGLMYFHAKPRTCKGPGPKPYCQMYSNEGYFDKTRRPTLIITMEDIYLLQRPLPAPPECESEHLDDSNKIIIQHPLHEPSRWPTFLGSHDRLCLHAQIPELGIFIIASPAGRAAICSVTKYRSGDGHSWKFGMYMEYMLPFGVDKNGEERIAKFEMQARLVGVAVGPVQGEFDDVSSGGEDEVGMKRDRKWRLLMYYTDHTVLGFEIARKRGEEDTGLSELVV